MRLAVVAMAWAASASQPIAARPAVAAVGVPLTKADLDIWLDGFLPNALATGDIAGAVVVVVKGGRVLTGRGFGVSDVAAGRAIDPDNSLLRLGSVSKLVTWIAVMQQVEARRLDLDRDINAYLDFRIAAGGKRAITLRDLMTHTAGFEDHMKRLFVSRPDKLISLRRYLETAPARIYPPGEVPAYSNYGAALAAYIVERVSGEPFALYAERHVFAPLGMTKSTFRQPLPQGLERWMGKTYARASAEPGPFELVNAFPAGGMTASGEDMARFMVDLLDRNSRLLSATSIAMLETPQNRPARPFETMGLGFIPTSRNRHFVTGHDGDLQRSKAVLYLLPHDGIGIFVGFNSVGADHAAVRIRTSLLYRFMDRYFPVANPMPQPIASAARHGREIAGSYASSRTAGANFTMIRSLFGQAPVEILEDASVRIPHAYTVGDAPERWIETAPYLWTNASGDFHMTAIRRGGKVVGLATDEDTTSMLIRVPWWRSAALNLALLYVTLAILVGGLVAGLTVRGSRPAAGWLRWLDRAVRLAAASDLAAAAIYGSVLARMQRVDRLDDLDLWIHVGQVLALAGAAGGLIGVANLIAVWREPSPGRWRRFESAALAVALGCGAWLVWLFDLAGWGMSF